VDEVCTRHGFDWFLKMIARGMHEYESCRTHGLRFSRRPIALVVLAATFWGIPAAVWACDTPVYRYAMYRWTPLPYEVYYFHRGQPPKADQEMHRLLAEKAEKDKGGSAANVFVTPVDLDRKDALNVLPEPVKKAWQARGGKPVPSCLVLSPWGSELFAGQLDATAARELAESPSRTEIGKMFDKGFGVVLLIVGGGKPEGNARMEAVARTVIAKAEAGKLVEEPAPGPNMPGPQGPAGKATGDSEPATSGGVLRVGLLKLDRSQTAERWLLKILTAMDPDPEKAPSRSDPMLFAIYGRGRVMPPGIGNEVTAESLTELLRFLTGRCSCTIKDQNPGLDLLMRWDWEATAEKFAAEDQATARPPLYAEVPADAGNPSPPAAKAGEKGPAATPNASTAGVAVAQPATGPPQTVPAAPTISAPACPVSGVASPAAPESEPSATESPEQDRFDDGFATRQRSHLGIGLAGLAAVVVAAGFVLGRLMRKQHHDSP
jgi:hypothetical protein